MSAEHSVHVLAGNELPIDKQFDDLGHDGQAFGWYAEELLCHYPLL